MGRMRGVVVAALLGGALTGVLAACEPVTRSHGYTPDDALLADVTVGQDTRDTVAQKIGRPITTSTFDDEGWYYVSSTIEQYLYNAPRVVDRRIVAVRFDDNDVVADVNTYGVEDGRIIDLATQTTPTHGRELTILQQVLGNLGRITAQDVVEEQ